MYFLMHKDQVLVNFKQFKALIENKTRKKIKWLRMNNGLGYCSGEHNEFYKMKERWDIGLLTIHHSKMEMQNTWTGFSWNELILCDQMLGLAKTLGPK